MMRAYGSPPKQVHALDYPFILPPDTIRYAADLGDFGWETATGFTNLGSQATFDIFAEGSTTQGLRVTIARAALAAGASNGVVVNVIHDTPRTVTFTVADKTIDIQAGEPNTLSQVKTSVDADTNLTSAYFGSEAGTSTFDPTSLVTSNATEDRPSLIEIRNGGQIMLYDAGTATPSNNDTASYIFPNSKFHTILAAGDAPYTRRSATDAPGTMRIWKL